MKEKQYRMVNTTHSPRKNSIFTMYRDTGIKVATSQISTPKKKTANLQSRRDAQSPLHLPPRGRPAPQATKRRAPILGLNEGAAEAPGAPNATRPQTGPTRRKEPH